MEMVLQVVGHSRAAVAVVHAEEGQVGVGLQVREGRASRSSERGHASEKDNREMLASQQRMNSISLAAAASKAISKWTGGGEGK